MMVKAAEVGRLPEGAEVELLGWVRPKRVHGKLLFIDLRDGSGVVQVALKAHEASEQSFQQALSAGRESAVRIVGLVAHDSRAPGGVEVRARVFELISPSLEEYPLRKGVGARFLSDNRHLAIRGPKAAAILRFRAKLVNSIRAWFEREGFVEVHCPTFITAAVEGGATLFKVDYFGREVYLTQSVQFLSGGSHILVGEGLQHPAQLQGGEKQDQEASHRVLAC
jgi:asparaginyl-tRNA synthetase